MLRLTFGLEEVYLHPDFDTRKWTADTGTRADFMGGYASASGGVSVSGGRGYDWCLVGDQCIMIRGILCSVSWVSRRHLKGDRPKVDHASLWGS